MYAFKQMFDNSPLVADNGGHLPVKQPSKNNRSEEGPVHALRSHTRLLHQVLENTPTARALLSPAITLVCYAEHLVIWAAAWKKIEQSLYESPFAKRVPQLLPCPRAGLAEADLAYLYSLEGVRSSHKPLHHSAVDTSSLNPENLSGFIGICYVLRGASLGGKVIAKHLESTLAMSVDRGASFFSAGSGDYLSWDQWIRSANQMLSIENDIDLACHWASATFELLITAFSGSTYNASESALLLCDTGPTNARLVGHG